MWSHLASKFGYFSMVLKKVFVVFKDNGSALDSKMRQRAFSG
jgi:hypothetical protein